MTSVPHSGAKSGAHTPGPWRTNGCYISSNFGEVGHVYWVSGMPEGMDEANAALMSAAPELLESLIEHLAINERHMLREGFSQEQIECSTTKARQRISKATAGETRNAGGAL